MLSEKPAWAVKNKESAECSEEYYKYKRTVNYTQVTASSLNTWTDADIQY